MSKRKAEELEWSSGESSDDATVGEPVAKKPNTPWAPVRFSVQPSRPFQLPNRADPPGSRLEQVTPSSSRLKLKPAVPSHLRLPTPQATPSLGNDSGASTDEDTPSHDAPSASVGKKANDRTVVPTAATVSSADPLARSRLALEKSLNNLLSTLEESEKRNEERHRQNEEQHARNAEYHERTDQKLDQICDTISALALQIKQLPTKSVDDSDDELAPVAPPSKLVLRNPPVTEAMTALVKKVVKNRAQRAEEKKKTESTQDENSTKDHTRQTFYGVMGNIKQAKDIPPPFFDKNGKPDIFPAFAVDPDTGYCQPYPDWTSPLSNQPEWVPTYIERFRKTIPNNGSALSKHLQGLSDEEIIAYMHDGPFSTARNTWRAMAKSDEALKQRQSDVRQKWRLDRVVAIRTSYRKEAPALQGPEFNWVFHREAMSCQVSDSEGNLVTYNPQWRASWVRDFWDSVDSAELQKAMKKRGLCPRPRRPKFDKGSSKFPQITKTAANGREVPVVVAYCGLKKVWRRENRELINSSPHLIDKSLKANPSISDFVDRYPPIDYAQAANDESDGSPAPAITQADAPSEGEDPDAPEPVGWGLDDVDGGEVADDEEDEEVPAPVAQQVAPDLIDPELQETARALARPRPKMIARPPAHQPDVPVPPPTIQVAASSTATAADLGTIIDEFDPPPTGIPPPHSTNHLPPPPSLLRQAQAAAELAAAQVPIEEPAVKKRAKKKAPAMVAGPSSATSAHTGGEASTQQGADALEGEKGLPKKRGRPPGSKNKKKAQV